MNIQPISVSELNKYIKNKFADDEMLANVFVKGEISNFKHHYTGHMYFTLKDGNSLIKCIMFKTYTGNLKFTPKDGLGVMILGSVSVFERDGVYQIYCKAMQEDGIGNLYKSYEELKEKLEKEGLFSQSNKKKIPYMPKRVGVLTSKTGSVIQDIINVSTRRNPNINLKLLPVPVQGEGAGIKIAEAIEIMNKKELVDVLIIARGGGSLEDLWPFNEEIVARAIYESKIPIISAVGHETDFSISDFVADLRAPTPSAAAELAVPNIVELHNRIIGYENRFKLSLKKKTELMRLRYEKCMMRNVFKDPIQKINEQYIRLDILLKSIDTNMNVKLNNRKSQAMNVISKLDALSPLKTLTRGYSIVQKNNEIIKSINDLEIDDKIDIRFIDGQKKAKVLK